MLAIQNPDISSFRIPTALEELVTIECIRILDKGAWPKFRMCLLFKSHMQFTKPVLHFSTAGTKKLVTRLKRFDFHTYFLVNKIVWDQFQGQRKNIGLHLKKYHNQFQFSHLQLHLHNKYSFQYKHSFYFLSINLSQARLSLHINWNWNCLSLLSSYEINRFRFLEHWISWIR